MRQAAYLHQWSSTVEYKYWILEIDGIQRSRKVPFWTENSRVFSDTPQLGSNQPGFMVYYWTQWAFCNTLKPVYNDHRFADDNYQYVFFTKIVSFQFKCHLNVFLYVNKNIYFRWWLRAQRATKQCLNKRWPCLKTHSCVTWFPWV